MLVRKRLRKTHNAYRVRDHQRGAIVRIAPVKSVNVGAALRQRALYVGERKGNAQPVEGSAALCQNAIPVHDGDGEGRNAGRPMPVNSDALHERGSGTKRAACENKSFHDMIYLPIHAGTAHGSDYYLLLAEKHKVAVARVIPNVCLTRDRRAINLRLIQHTIARSVAIRFERRGIGIPCAAHFKVCAQLLK